MGIRGGGALGEVDWAVARRRLAEAARFAGEALTPPPDRARQILDARARGAAQPLAEPAPQGEILELVAFGLGGSTHLIESRFLRGVLAAPTIAPVPRAPRHLVGIANFGGELAPVYSLAVYYGFTDEAASEKRQAAVIGERQAEFAILVDWVAPAEPIAADSFQTASSDGEIRGKHVRGITVDGRILLDGAALIDERDFYIQS